MILPIAEYLALSTMTIATGDQAGEPHAAAVYFAADADINFYFFSDPKSQHGQDITHRPQCAITIFPESQDWQEIHGVQMRGEVHLVEPGPEWEGAWILYKDKFPFVSELRELVARNQLYTFVPAWARLVDNRRGFGFKQEWRKTLQGNDQVESIWQSTGFDDPQTGARRGGA